jgi:hypothetical protein
MIKFLFIMLLSLLPAYSVETVRAAIDFGSGAVKIQVAVVETDTNRIVGKPLLADFTPIMLTEDVAAHGGKISPEKIEKAIEVLRQYKANALEIAASRPVDFIGIATAVFRKANNGAEVLQLIEQNTGISFRILSQEEEGRLGFLTAQALFPEVPESNLIAWDSGNGSFQISSDSHVYLAPLGHGNVRILLSEMRGKPILQAFESGNPLLPGEAFQLSFKIRALLPPVPKWFIKKLIAKETVIATFGDGESIFYIAAKAYQTLLGIDAPIEEIELTRKKVNLMAFLAKEDQELTGFHYKTVTSLLLISTIMDQFGIERIHFKKSMGNTSGMLVWKPL